MIEGYKRRHTEMKRKCESRKDRKKDNKKDKKRKKYGR
jgi:hypothetical protein